MMSTISCGRSSSVGNENNSDSHCHIPDTLRVGTLYSPMSYFIYREEKMGYDYDLVSRFASDKGVVLDLHVGTSLNSLIEQLDSGDIDLIAYEVPITAEYRDRVYP